MVDFNPRPTARSARVAHVITTARPPRRPPRTRVTAALASAAWSLAAAFAGVPVPAWWRARAAAIRQAWCEYRAMSFDATGGVR